MKKRMISCVLVATFLLLSLSACKKEPDDVKIGVSFGVGEAARWDLEKKYMEEQAKELGAAIEIRINRTDEPKTQTEDCLEMIDDGIDVLILTPRDVTKVDDILDYAKKKNVPVISYARVVLGLEVDLFVGYDSNRIGQKLGQYLTDTVYSGDYILLRGDEGDGNATLLHEGAMRYISQIEDDINIITDQAVPKWSPEEAKKIVLEAVAANNNRVDAILAPNDKIAGACADALAELGVTNHVVITGMDAEIDALNRIVSETQDVTIYMDLQVLATTAISEAYNIATGAEVDVNAEFDNESKNAIDANLITGQLVTKENLDKLIIQPGIFTKEEIYGENAQ